MGVVFDRLREGDEGFQALPGGARIDRFDGDRDAIEEIGGAPGGHQSRGGISQDDFTMRAVLTIGRAPRG
jgi:hypothetical protein